MKGVIDRIERIKVVRTYMPFVFFFLFFLCITSFSVKHKQCCHCSWHRQGPFYHGHCPSDTQHCLILLHTFFQGNYEKEGVFKLWGLASRTHDISNTVPVSAPGEALEEQIVRKKRTQISRDKLWRTNCLIKKGNLFSLVGSAIASAHVVPLVPGEKANAKKFPFF